MKKAARILYNISIIICPILAALYVIFSIILLINANNEQLIDSIFEIINRFIEYPKNDVTYLYISSQITSYGISFAIDAIFCIICMSLSISARNRLNDLVNQKIAPFVATIVFGVFSTPVAIVAGILALIERNIEINNKPKTNWEGLNQ